MVKLLVRQKLRLLLEIKKNSKRKMFFIPIGGYRAECIALCPPILFASGNM